MELFALRLGFIALIDAAPVIAAQERGFFVDEGLGGDAAPADWVGQYKGQAFLRRHLDAARGSVGMRCWRVIWGGIRDI